MKSFLLFLLLAPLALFAQNAKIDSLKHVIETTKVDSVKGRTLCRLCNVLREVGNYEEGLTQGKKGLELSRKLQDRKGEGNCLNNIGIIYSVQGDYVRALEYNQRSLKIREEIGDQAGVGTSLNNIGAIYYNQGDFARALNCYHRSLKIREKISDRVSVSMTLGNIGTIYCDQGDYARALDYYQRSLKIKEEIGDRAGVATALNNIGVIFDYQGHYPRALEFYQRSLKIKEEIGNRAGVAMSLGNIGSLYDSQGDYASALAYFQRSLKIEEEIGNLAGVAGTLHNIGGTYKRQGNRARALEYFQRSLKIQEEIGDLAGMASSFNNLGAVFVELNLPDRALTFAQQGLRIAKKVGHMPYKLAAARCLYAADSALGNWKGAFEAARLFHVYSDSMKNDAQSQELGRLEAQAKYDKQTEIDRLKNEEDKRRERERFTWMLGSTGGGIALLLIIAFTLFRGRQKEKKANTALRNLNEEIQQQKSEIEAINSELQVTLDEVNQQRQELEEQHAKIEDSIRYASRIQHAILPSTSQLQENLPPHFIHYQPRDIVSGDFYWMTRHGGKIFFAVVDCTGHGVPGAFMSVLGSNLLHQIVDENQITEPDVILAELDRRIAATLRQQFGGDSKDGMDLALVVLHEADKNGRRTVEYAGAGRPLWHWSNGEITEYKSAKYSCGGSQHEGKTYPAHSIEAQVGDRLYIFSDGPVDQFGGPNGRKLGSTQLQSFLSETANLPIDEQGKRFGAFFNDWMKAKKQLDDVLLAGVAL